MLLVTKSKTRNGCQLNQNVSRNSIADSRGSMNVKTEVSTGVQGQSPGRALGG